VPGASDRRTVLATLTESGHGISSRLTGSHESKLAKAFQAFHPSDRLERAVALDRVAEALEKTDSSSC
jgi:hypothetical protein